MKKKSVITSYGIKRVWGKGEKMAFIKKLIKSGKLKRKNKNG